VVGNNYKFDYLFDEDQKKFGYLFPESDRIPEIKKHIFTDLRQSKMPVNKFIISKMMNTDYLGWAAKVLLNQDLLPIQIATLRVMWKTTFPMLVACRGGSKSYMLAVYALLRGILDQGVKIIIVGRGLRQAKLVFGYIESIWNQSPILRSIVGGGKKAGPKQNVDSCYFYLGDSQIRALPLGDGSSIRGFRANVILADEFAVIPPDVFDIVVRGFASTTKTPIEEARRRNLEKKLAKLDIPQDISKNILGQKVKGNQIVYSGTAYYQFNHFAQKYKMWRDIIHSRGDPNAVAEIFGGPNMIPDDFDYRDYAIIRIPYTRIIDDLLDRKQLAHSKATLPRNIFMMEYGGCFVADSDGFFPRSLIESCSCRPGHFIQTLDGDVEFSPMLRRIKNRRYVMGIDPAAERDNLTIVIIERWANHSRVVFCWAVNKKTFSERKAKHLIEEKDYYEYCCAKIRDVYDLFRPERIEMDSQGGGYAISEMLRNKKLLSNEKQEFPIYEIIDPKEEKETDGETDGPHILHLVQQSSEFNAKANICLHKSFETKKLLFPSVDPLKMQHALIAERANNIIIDTYDENVDNIEELKNELCTIQMSETITGKERFDTPTVVTAGAVEGRAKRGRLKKDRYTSLLLAHKYIYDTETQPQSSVNYDDVVGNVKKVKGTDPTEGLYRGPGVGRFQNFDNRNFYGGVYGGEKI